MPLPPKKEDDRGVTFTRDSAKAIAETVRAVRGGGNRNQPPVSLAHSGGGGDIVLAVFTPPWNKGASMIVTDANSNQITYTAKNYFANLAGSGAKYCAIARTVHEWILIAAEC